MTRRPPDVVEFCTDPQLLGLSISPAQRTLLKAIYALPMTAEERELFELCTGRTEPPSTPFGEVAVIAGARAGKDSRLAAPLVCYEATFGGHPRHAGKGETPTIVLIAQDQRGTRIAFTYIRSYFERSPLLATMLAEPPLTSEIRLTTGVQIVCFPCTLKSVRGFSIPVGVLDELAFFRLEGQADSDVEIQASVRRGMLNFPAPKLVKISTPYMRSGVLYDDLQRYWGVASDDVLVWKASSALMNPSLTPERLARERRLDPSRYVREFEAEFAEALESFLPSAWVDEAVVVGRHELAPQSGTRYVAAIDPTGGGSGAGADAFTLAIVHCDGSGDDRRVIQDVMKVWTRRRGGAPVDLEGAVREIATVVKRYGLSVVHGDRYAVGWVRERLRAEGCRYAEPLVPDPTAAGTERYLDRSRAYLECEPLFAQGRIALLDHAVLARELKLLERRPRSGGSTEVGHPRGGHDDHANALCLAAALATRAPAADMAAAAAILAMNDSFARASYWRSGDVDEAPRTVTRAFAQTPIMPAGGYPA